MIHEHNEMAMLTNNKIQIFWLLIHVINYIINFIVDKYCHDLSEIDIAWLWDGEFTFFHDLSDGNKNGQ